MEMLFKKGEADKIKERLNFTDPQKSKGKKFRVEFITGKEPVILNFGNKEKIANTFLPQIQDIIGDRFTLSLLSDDDDPLAKRSYVKVFMEDKQGSFPNSGLSAPFFELSESTQEDKLEGKVKTSGTTTSEIVNLSEPKNLDSSFKEVFEVFLSSYEKEFKG